MGAIRTVFGIAIIAISCWLAFFGREWDTQAMSVGTGRSLPGWQPYVPAVRDDAASAAAAGASAQASGAAAVAPVAAQSATTETAEGQDSAADPDVVLTIAAEALNLRSEPSMAGTVLGSYPRGTTATELRREGNWVEVRIDETTGWMSTRYLQAG